MPLRWRLGRLVLAEVVGDPLAEGDHAEELLRPGRLRRVEVLDGAAQVDECLAHLGPLGQRSLVERLDRHLEHPVGRLGREADLVGPHAPHVGRLGLPLRGLRRGLEQRAEVLVDLRVQPGKGGLGHGRGHLRRRRLRDGADGGGGVRVRCDSVTGGSSGAGAAWAAAGACWAAGWSLISNGSFPYVPATS